MSGTKPSKFSADNIASAIAFTIGLAVMTDALYTSQHTPTAEDVEKERQSLVRSAQSTINTIKLKQAASSCVLGVGTLDQHVGSVAAKVMESLKQPPLATNAALEECYNIAANNALQNYNAHMRAAENIKPSDLNQVSAFQWGFAFAALGFGVSLGLRSRKTSQGNDAATKNNGDETSMPPSTPAP